MNKPAGQFYLFAERRFLPLFVTQFLGALNDNLFKNALLVIIVSTAVAESESGTNFLTNLAAGLFILPFLLFSSIAGQLADRFDKALLMRRIKLAEILLMLLGCLALWQNNMNLMLGVLFLLGAQSTFFSPAKYAIIPQHVRSEELLAANAQISMGTFVAILLGTLIGGWLVAGPQGPMQMGVLIIAVATIGWLSSRKIPSAPAAQTNPRERLSFNPVREAAINYKLAKNNKTVIYCIFAASWFWLFGGCFLTQVPNFAVTILAGHPRLISILLTAFIIGVATGSLLCHRLSRGKIEPGLVPIGTLGLSLFALDLYLSSTTFAAVNQLANSLMPMQFLLAPNGLRLLLDLVFIGLFGGLFVVPLYAMIQRDTEDKTRARVLSVNNIFNALFMVAGSLLGMLCLSVLGFTIPEFFVVVAVLNLGFMSLIFYLEPLFLNSLKQWLKITRTPTQ